MTYNNATKHEQDNDEDRAGGTDTKKGAGIFLIIVSVGILILFLMFLLLRRFKMYGFPTSHINRVRTTIKRRRPVSDESALTNIKVPNASRFHSSDRCFATCNPTYMLLEDSPENSHVKFCEHLRAGDLKEDILKEFRKLPSSDFRPTKIGSHEDNSMKNRYRDVLPFDETRIELDTTEEEESDYINASYIKGYKDRMSYVAAQGPNIHVTNDFWRMIWQLKPNKIVMLTNLIEKGKIKCEKYWPTCDPEHSTYRKFNVQCADEEVFDKYTSRTLKVWKDEEEPRSISLFHFTAWPDHGVPDTQSILDFHKLVMESEPAADSPILVHCSAGVGRTGTFIALDILLQQAREEGEICIFNCVKELRHQRMKMVQTKEQYKFCYDMIVRALEFHEITAENDQPILIQCHKCLSEKQKQTGNMKVQRRNYDRNPDSGARQIVKRILETYLKQSGGQLKVFVRPDTDPTPEEDSHYVEIWNCGLGQKLKLFQRGSKAVSEVGDDWEMSPLLAGITLFMDTEDEDETAEDKEDKNEES